MMWGKEVPCNTGCTLIVVETGHRNQLFILQLSGVNNHDLVASPPSIIVIRSVS